MAPNLRFLAELLHNVYGLPLEPVVGEDDGTVADSRSKCEDLKPSAKVQDVKTVLSPKKDLRGEGTETPVSDNDINFEDTEPEAQKEGGTKHVEKNIEKEGGVDVKQVDQSRRVVLTPLMRGWFVISQLVNLLLRSI